MAQADTEKYNVSGVSGNADTLVAGSVITGNPVFLATLQPGTLSALVAVDCETSTMTMTAKWQVSKDKSTWVDIVSPNNPAGVALATGTAGADATVTKAIECPLSSYGWGYARLVIVTGVVTGNAVDTYAISYCYRDFGATQFLS